MARRRKTKREYHRAPGLPPMLVSGGVMGRTKLVRGPIGKTYPDDSFPKGDVIYRKCSLCAALVRLGRQQEVAGATFYARLRSSDRWAYLCESHWRLNGMGLGANKGMKIRIDPKLGDPSQYDDPPKPKPEQKD